MNKGIEELMNKSVDVYEYYIGTSKEILKNKTKFVLEEFKNFMIIKNYEKKIKINFINSIFPLNKEDISFLVNKKRIPLDKKITNENYMYERNYVIKHCKRDLEILTKLLYLLKNKC